MRYLLAILVLITFDQISKTYFISYLETQPQFTFQVLSFLYLVYTWNYGISFGFFKQYYYCNNILLILNSFIILYLVNLLLKSHSKLSLYALTFIIGGALGNLIDRVIREGVFDFIYFKYHGTGFPVFNFADTFITIGAVMFLYDSILNKK